MNFNKNKFLLISLTNFIFPALDFFCTFQWAMPNAHFQKTMKLHFEWLKYSIEYYIMTLNVLIRPAELANLRTCTRKSIVSANSCFGHFLIAGLRLRKCRSFSLAIGSKTFLVTFRPEKKISSKCLLNVAEEGNQTPMVCFSLPNSENESSVD